MKKLLFAVLFVTIMAFTSCKEEIIGPLNGTSWRNKGTENEQVSTIKFEDTSFLLYSTWMKDGKQQLFEDNGSYSYNDPIVKIFINGETIPGIIEEDRLTIEGFVFIKK